MLSALSVCLSVGRSVGAGKREREREREEAIMKFITVARVGVVFDVVAAGNVVAVVVIIVIRI